MNSKTQLRFELDEWVHEFIEVELETEALLTRIGGPIARLQEPMVIRPTERQWQEFWEAVERARVWNWLPRYENICLDGTEWSLQLQLGEKRIVSEGSNGFPGGNNADYDPNSEFGVFLSALRRLIAQPK